VRFRWQTVLAGRAGVGDTFLFLSTRPYPPTPGFDGWMFGGWEATARHTDPVAGVGWGGAACSEVHGRPPASLPLQRRTDDLSCNTRRSGGGARAGQAPGRAADGGDPEAPPRSPCPWRRLVAEILADQMWGWPSLGPERISASCCGGPLQPRRRRAGRSPALPDIPPMGSTLPLLLPPFNRKPELAPLLCAGLTDPLPGGSDQLDAVRLGPLAYVADVIPDRGRHQNGMSSADPLATGWLLGSRRTSVTFR
jgi:hypothetical protein